MYYYKLRVDTDCITSLEQLLLKYSSEYLICIENEGADNPHCHAYFESLVKDSTIRVPLRKAYGSGNASYSLKLLDEQYPVEYLAYCVKEKHYRHTLPSDVIEKAIAYDKQVKETMKAKREAKVPVWKKILESLKEKGNEYDYDEILDAVIDYHFVNNLLYRRFQVQAYADTIYLHLGGEHARFYLKQDLVVPKELRRR